MTANTNLMGHRRPSRRSIGALLFAVAVSAVAYAPILHGYFRSDDFLHLYQLRNFDFLSNLLASHAGHAYTVRNFVFYLCWSAFGMSPTGYHAVALATHLVNVGLLFVVVRRLTRSDALACFGAATWGTCPQHGEVLAWYSVFGHALAATALLIILVQLAGSVADRREPTQRMLATWYVVALAGATCFGVGIGIAMALPWAIALFFPDRYGWRRPPLWSLAIVAPVIYVAAMRAYQWRWNVSQGVITTTQSVLGESGWRLPIALWRLATYGFTQLLVQLWWPGGMPINLAAAIGTALIVTLVAVAVYARGSTGRQLGACALLAIGAYGMVAVGRGFLFTSKPTLLEIAGRYHYAALVPLTIATCIALQRLAAGLPLLARWPRRSLFFAWAVATVAGVALIRHPLDLGAAEFAQVRQFQEQVYTAAAAASPGESSYVRNRVFQPVLMPGPSFPKMAAVFTLLFPDQMADGRYIYFVESDAPTRAAVPPDSPIARVLVAPEDVPRDAMIH